MRIAIINCFSPERLDYTSILNKEKDELVMFTKKKFEKYFSEQGIVTYGYEDFDNDGNLYLDIINEHKKIRLDAIIATHEFDIEKAALLRDYLGISGQNYKSGLQFRDKYLMKKSLVNTVPVPNFSKINNSLDIVRFIDQNDFPVVIKPRTGAGSVSVWIIRDEKELSEFLKQPTQHNLMIEKFVDGEMYHVDGLYKNNELVYSHPSKYINTCLSFDQNLALGSYQLSQSSLLCTLLNEKVETVLNTLETPNHVIPFHAEFFVNQDNIIFCEIASRVGGGMINEGAIESHKIDLMAEGILGQVYQEREIKAFKQSLTGWVIIPPKIGILESIDISSEDWIVDYNFKNEDLGKEFHGGDSSASQIISYLVSGDSEQEIQDRIDKLIKWQEENIVWLPKGEKITTAKIIYASLTGNTEEIVNYVEKFLKEQNVAVSIDHCDDFDSNDFKDADICIIATYTYGDGDLPDEIIHVYESLSSLNLSNKIFGVCGSGDTFYEEFCKSVDDFETAFIKAGAIKGTNSVKVDVNVGEDDLQNINLFATDLYKAHKKHLEVTTNE